MGAEEERLQTTTDPRIKRRVYFYLPVADDIPQAVMGLGSDVYQADLDDLYNPTTATASIRGEGNAFELAVLDAGYVGYISPEQGTIMMLGRDV